MSSSPRTSSISRPHKPAVNLASDQPPRGRRSPSFAPHRPRTALSTISTFLAITRPHRHQRGVPARILQEDPPRSPHVPRVLDRPPRLRSPRRSAASNGTGQRGSKSRRMSTTTRRTSGTRVDSGFSRGARARTRLPLDGSFAQRSVSQGPHVSTRIHIHIHTRSVVSRRRTLRRGAIFLGCNRECTVRGFDDWSS